jgi:hypothetical protein
MHKTQLPIPFESRPYPEWFIAEKLLIVWLPEVETVGKPKLGLLENTEGLLLLQRLNCGRTSGILPP